METQKKTSKPFLSESNRNKLVGGVIGVVILALGLLVKNWLEPRLKKQEPTISATSNDSSNQVINQPNQKNQVNSGDVVNGDKIAGDKVQGDKVGRDKKVEIHDNHTEGPIIKYGDTTIVTKPPQRIAKNLPELDAVAAHLKKLNKPVKVAYLGNDNESKVLAFELMDELAKRGVVINTYTVINMTTEDFGKKYFTIIENETFVEIRVNPQS